jgi:hypothetical protein
MENVGDIYLSMSELPAKVGLYATLIGLCNSRLPEIGAEVVRALSESLQICLQNEDFIRVKILVR